MMKFRGYREQFPAPDNSKYRFNSDNGYLWAGAIPTVDEVDEVLSPMYADTVIQILRGDGIYRGHDYTRYPDNQIHFRNEPKYKEQLTKRTLILQKYYSQSSDVRRCIRILKNHRRITLSEATKLWFTLIEN